MKIEDKTNLALYATDNTPSVESIIDQVYYCSTIAYEIDLYVKEIFEYIDECIRVGRKQFIKKYNLINVKEFNFCPIGRL